MISFFEGGLCICGLHRYDFIVNIDYVIHKERMRRDNHGKET